MTLSRNKAQAAKDDEIAALGCIVCRLEKLVYSPAEIHHLRAGCGTSQRNHDRRIPLCFKHHKQEGLDGIHGGQKSWEARHGSEEELLAETEKLL